MESSRSISSSQNYGTEGKVRGMPEDVAVKEEWEGEAVEEKWAEVGAGAEENPAKETSKARVKSRTQLLRPQSHSL
jgi:hypothetical protein